MNITNILPRIVSLLAISLLALSCTRESDDPLPDGPVDITVHTRSIPANHTCNLYIFKNNALLKVVSLPSGTVTLTMNQSDLVSSNNFRFLYVAQPTGISNGVEVKDNGTNTAPVAGNTWTNLRIEAKAPELSGDIFYKIDTYTGTTLAGTPSISTVLTRLVGQQVIDIFKVGTGLTDPIDTSTDVASVLDRVTGIGLTYTGLTKVISFDASNQIVEQASWGAWNKTLSIAPNTTPGTDLLKVTLPQDSVKVLTGLNGGAHLMGVWGLQSTGKVKIVAKFSYRHTTPTLCSASNPATHTHTPACFPHRNQDSGGNQALFLNLPKNGGINMVPNTYTVTIAGIKYDRVIDVGVSGGFGFLTDWDNGNVGP